MPNFIEIGPVVLPPCDVEDFCEQTYIDPDRIAEKKGCLSSSASQLIVVNHWKINRQRNA